MSNDRNLHHRRRVALRSAPFLALAGLLAAAAGAQAPQPRLECEDAHGGFLRFFTWRDRVTSCEMREHTLAATGALAVDAGNGGVHVTGWDRDDVLVRAQVTVRGGDEDEAQAHQREIEIRTDGVIRAEGPRDRSTTWRVSYEIFTPRQTDLELDGRNGGLVLTDLEGDIDFETTNGGVVLSGLAGDVRGTTTNGGVVVRLTGSTWDGEGLDVGTTNGGVQIRAPEEYSARFEASTTNGGVHIGFPVTVQGRFGGGDVSATLGEGGPLVRVRTTNGGVHVTSY